MSPMETNQTITEWEWATEQWLDSRHHATAWQLWREFNEVDIDSTEGYFAWVESDYFKAMLRIYAWYVLRIEL